MATTANAPLGVACQDHPARAEIICVGGVAKGVLISRIDPGSGSLLGRVTVPSVEGSGFSIVGDEIVVIDRAEFTTYTRVDPRTGEQRWLRTFRLQDDGRFRESTMWAGNILAARVNTGQDDASFETEFVDLETGKTLTTMPGGWISLDGVRWVGDLNNENSTGIRLISLDGSVAWSVPTVNRVLASGAVGPEVVLATTGKLKYLGESRDIDPASDQMLIAVDMATGKTLWERPWLASTTEGRFVSDRLQLGDQILDLADGRSLGQSFGKVVGSTSTSIITADSAGSVRAISKKDMSVAWLLDLTQMDSGASGYSVFATGGHLHAYLGGHMYIFDPVVGSSGS